MSVLKRTVISSAAAVALVSGLGVGAASAATPVSAVTSTPSSSVAVLVAADPAAAGVTLVSPGAAPVSDFAVSIDALPSSARAHSQVPIYGSSSGFADGNWVNAWVKDSSGKQISAGGNWVKAGKFKLPISVDKPGDYTVQLSLGAFPDEKYSSPVALKVTKALYDTKPLLTQDGHNGQRYLHVDGWAKGKKVNIYVTSPHRLLPAFAGSVPVAADGTYSLASPTDATLLNKDGFYTVVVTGSSGVVGVSTYQNSVYKS